MKILVTGGAGFIGSHVVDELIKKKHKVFIVDDLSYGRKENINTQAKFYKLDIQSKKVKQLFQKNKFDVVMHLAAQKNVRSSMEDPSEDAQINILGSLSLLELSVKHKVKKFIFASTGGVIYGDTPQRPTPESFHPRPESPYAISKYAIDNYLHYYSKVHGLDCVSLRLGNVYGSRQDPKGEAGVVAIFISQILAGQQPVINGNGGNTRDYVYVEDVVKAFVKSIDKKAQGVYNVGTSKETSVNEIFRKIVKIMRVEVKEKHGQAVLGEQKNSSLKITRIKKQLNWGPQHNLEQGLRKTIKLWK